VLYEFVRQFRLIQIYSVTVFVNQKLFCEFCKSFWFLFVKFEIKQGLGRRQFVLAEELFLQVYETLLRFEVRDANVGTCNDDYVPISVVFEALHQLLVCELFGAAVTIHYC